LPPWISTFFYLDRQRAGGGGNGPLLSGTRQFKPLRKKMSMTSQDRLLKVSAVVSIIAGTLQILYILVSALVTIIYGTLKILHYFRLW
jgi:hypothetical protein